MIINTDKKQCDRLAISSELTSMVGENDFARLKLFHGNNLEPFAYAIGFGNKFNSSLIVGGSHEEDSFSQQILILLAKLICESISKNNFPLGVNLSQLFIKKGLWIIPDLKLANQKNAQNFIEEKLNPKRLMDVNLFSQAVKYNFGKNVPVNSKLLAYLLASSSGYNIEMGENNSKICEWFACKLRRPAYSLSIGNEDVESLTTDNFLSKLLEAFIIFIAA